MSTTEKARNTLGINDEIAGALRVGMLASHVLADDHDVRVIAAMANGRRPLLYVDRMPQSVEAVVKRSNPNGFGGITRVLAASFMGCQLEALEDITPAAPHRVEHEARAHLEVVRG